MHQTIRFGGVTYEVINGDFKRHPTIDHKVPVLMGGTDSIENLVLCCRSCNGSKGARPYSEFVNKKKGINQR